MWLTFQPIINCEHNGWQKCWQRPECTFLEFFHREGDEIFPHIVTSDKTLTMSMSRNNNSCSGIIPVQKNQKSLHTMETFQKFRWEIFCRPNLMPSDYHNFLHLKNSFASNDIRKLKSWIAQCRNWLKFQANELYDEGLKKFASWHQKYLERNLDYVEKCCMYLEPLINFSFSYLFSFHNQSVLAFEMCLAHCLSVGAGDLKFIGYNYLAF